MSAVMNPKQAATDAPGEALEAHLERQRAAFTAELPVAVEVRRDRLDRAIALLLDHQDALCEAMSADFGNRPAPFSRFVDIASSVNALKHARRHLKGWMKADPRHVRFPLSLLGARAWVEYQPLGVAGIVSPWNFPVNLTFVPLAGALAAGNRVMIKPSEHTPETSALLHEAVASRFDPLEVHVVTGGPDVAQAFTALPFDHLFFTGSTAIGRHVMRAAAENLTPVTLELGGKCPAIVGPEADLDRAADRIVLGKMMNAGQVCLAPDYALVPREHRDDFVGALEKAVRRLYPEAGGNVHYTMVLGDRNVERLRGYLAEAREAGVEVRELHAGPADTSDRRLPLTVLTDPDDTLTVMREEIFGPILPVKSYGNLDEALGYVNARARPLGLYYLGGDEASRRRVLDRTIAGGVTLGDVVFHISVDDLPFGGVGASGMGNYHGLEGFRTFSHAKAVYRQSRFDVAGLIGLKPPYGKRLEWMNDMDLRG